MSLRHPDQYLAIRYLTSMRFQTIVQYLTIRYVTMVRYEYRTVGYLTSMRFQTIRQWTYLNGAKAQPL